MPDFNNISWNALYVIDLIAIGLFVLSYYRKCYRRGYRIDFWYSQLFLICVLPNMLMLPFAKSELNEIVVGSDMAAIIAVLPTIFLITLVGYAAVLAGGGLWGLKLGAGLRRATAQVLDVVPRCSMMLMSSQSILVFQAAVCMLLQLLILVYYFSQSGLSFDLRGYTFANPELRPIALLISGYSVVIASHCLARFIDTRERALMACTLLLSLGLIFFGSRGNLLAIYINVLLCYLVQLRTRIGLFRIISLIGFITVVGFYLGNVRAGDYSLVSFVVSLAALLFYGNNFSDLRDFAWVYSSWDHVFWSGKTYAVALLSFIPRYASEFRDTWAVGAMTTSTIGKDPHVFGLRPGIFGEGFFNFGLLGVAAVGLLLGIILRRVDIDTKRALEQRPASMRRAFASTMLLNVAGALAITAGFSGLYVLGGIYVFSWFCLLTQRMFRPKSIEVAGAD